jgi:predicted dehydrogenase
VVVGSQKMVVYDDSSSEPVRVFDSGVSYEDPETFGQYQLSYRTGDIVSPKLETTEPIVTELKDFVSGVRDGRAPEGNPALAHNVVRLIEAAESSIEERGVPTPVESAVPQPAR